MSWQARLSYPSRRLPSLACDSESSPFWLSRRMGEVRLLGKAVLMRQDPVLTASASASARQSAPRQILLLNYPSDHDSALPQHYLQTTPYRPFENPPLHYHLVSLHLPAARQHGLNSVPSHPKHPLVPDSCTTVPDGVTLNGPQLVTAPSCMSQGDIVS